MNLSPTYENYEEDKIGTDIEEDDEEIYSAGDDDDDDEDLQSYV